MDEHAYPEVCRKPMDNALVRSSSEIVEDMAKPVSITANEEKVEGDIDQRHDSGQRGGRGGRSTVAACGRRVVCERLFASLAYHLHSQTSNRPPPNHQNYASPILSYRLWRRDDLDDLHNCFSQAQVLANSGRPIPPSSSKRVPERLRAR